MKTVLWITAHFPPIVNVASIRSVKFLKYLPETGWRSVVICPGVPSDANNTDGYLTRQLGKSVNIQRTRYNKLHGIIVQRKGGGGIKILRSLMNKAIPPDGYLYWILSNLSLVFRAVEASEPDIVLTTCSPFSLNLVGLAVKRKYNIPWVTDFRDLWTLNPVCRRYLNGYYQFISSKLERFYLKRCDRVIVNTKNSCQRMIHRYPPIADKISWIPNGYDAQDVIESGRPSTLPNSILYSGTIEQQVQYGPEPILRLLAYLFAGDVGASRWTIHYTGPDEDVFESLFHKWKLSLRIQSHGWLDHERYYRLIKRMTFILMCLPAHLDCRSWIPARIYDYMGNRATIVCMANKNSEVFDVLERYGNYLPIFHDDPLEPQLQRLKDHINSEKITRQSGMTNDIERYRRKDLTYRLSQIFDQLAPGS